MARKVFLSVLGTGFYEKCNYCKDNFCTKEPTRFIQIASLKYHEVEKWKKDDAVFILMTNKSRELNWQTSVSKTRCKNKYDNPEEYIGLEEELKALNLPIINKIDQNIPDGNNEKEMWKIFDTLYSIIEEEDELYVDLTHSFRYIPMLMMVFCNYAKFLKKIKVKSITYGNIFYKINDIPTINDITTLTVLQDWTSAADSFITSGNIEKISKIYLPEINERLSNTKGKDEHAKVLRFFINNTKSLVNELQLCQGKRLIEADTISKAQISIENISELDLPSPFKPILEKIEKSIKPFDNSNNVKNGIVAAKWCCDNGLFQQAITMLQESVVSMVCEVMNLDWHKKNKRKYVNNAFIIISNKDVNNSGNWELPEDEDFSDKDKKKIIKKIISIPLVNDLAESFSKLTAYRNKINHGTMLYNEGQFSNVDNVAETIKKMTEYIYNITYCESK